MKISRDMNLDELREVVGEVDVYIDSEDMISLRDDFLDNYFYDRTEDIPNDVWQKILLESGFMIRPKYV